MNNIGYICVDFGIQKTAENYYCTANRYGLSLRHKNYCVVKYKSIESLGISLNLIALKIVNRKLCRLHVFGT